MMPPGASKVAYQKQRARAGALERLGPAYMRRIIGAVAACLADGRRVRRDWFALLDDDELTQALQLAAKLAAMRRWRRITTAIGAVPSRLGEFFRHTVRFIMRSGPGSTRNKRRELP
jgi:hypothetical protein